jgi:hypothetical protein
MQRHFHREITSRALRNCFNPEVLETIIKANLGQDGLRGQLGHPEYHFDNCKFSEGRDYIRSQREIIFNNLLHLKGGDSFDYRREEIKLAWRALGRLIHAAQDFYSHSNYVALWLTRERLRASDEDHKIPVEKIDPLDPDLLYSTGLRSGHTYFPWDYLSIIRPLEPLFRQFAPLDSHAHMNLDSPDRGPKFAYAYVAALKRTRYEASSILKVLPQDLLWYFSGGVLKRNSDAVVC